jgi:hypothetical protein
MDKLTQEEECTAINQSQSANESDTNNDSDDYVLVGSLPRDNTEERRINREHYINLLTKPHFLATSHHKKKQKQQKVGHTLRQRAPFQLSLIIPKN